MTQAHPTPVISTAERPGVGLDGLPRPTEDRVVLLENAVVLLDGATSPTPRQRDGGWHSRELAAQFTGPLLGDLGEELAGAIDRLRARHGLVPGDSPSSTVAILRWSAETVDALVLADSPVVVFGPPGGPIPEEGEVVADHRLRDLRGKVAKVTDWRNRPGGFWVAEADPAAAGMAVRRNWPRDAVSTAVLATDGVSCGVDDYGLFPWQEVTRIAFLNGPEAVLDRIRAAEERDRDRTRWRRAKAHDDQAIAVIRFD